VVQTAEPGDAIVQALVRWDPWHLHAHEAARRAEAGFPPGHPIFRLRGTPDLPAALGDIDPPPVSVLSTPVGDETVSLVTIRPDAVGAFRAWVMEHLGVVTRVEANPDI
ncbi:MAG TPA: hypothetical protein VM638_04790, partial [Actinomycetota bacterium]|nr:hypothetical protein [Actinomycetota bacterium]